KRIGPILPSGAVDFISLSPIALAAITYRFTRETAARRARFLSPPRPPWARRRSSAALNACSFSAMCRVSFARARPRAARDLRGARRRAARRRGRARGCHAQSIGSVSTLRALGQFRRITTDMARWRRTGLALVWLLTLTGTAWGQGGTLRVGLSTVSPTLDPATALEGP